MPWYRMTLYTRGVDPVTVEMHRRNDEQALKLFKKEHRGFKGPPGRIQRIDVREKVTDITPGGEPDF